MSGARPNGFRTILVTGGAGYVGSALVPDLLERGYRVRVVDLFWYGRDVFGAAGGHPGLERLELDIRDGARLKDALRGVDAVIHLACISNDPSFELDPSLGRSVNYDAFAGLLQGAIDRGVKRFIYASSSSVYGVSDRAQVREDTDPRPLTDYSRYKLACERDLLAHPAVRGMERVIVRPATVCGVAPRMRLDLTVNTLTIHALVNRRIRIFGGAQLRPNLHIGDMVRAYRAVLEAPAGAVDGQAFNVGAQNLSVEDIARLVRETIGDASIALEYTPSDDLRSYHVDSEKILRALGFSARHSVADAVRDVAAAHGRGAFAAPLTNPIYYNVRQMERLGVT